VVGAFGCPTVVNNVETLAAVPWIILNGGAAYRKYGTEKSPGTKLWCMSGPIVRPGVYEIPLGYPFMKLLDEDCGGMKDGKRLKAVIPGGSSTPVLTAAECEDLAIDYEAIAAKGSMLGSGGCIVMNEDTCMVRALLVLEQFYAHESCGQCTPCREGTGWLAQVLARFERGTGRVQDLDLILDIGKNMVGKTICVLADAAEMPARSFITKFRDEFEEHVARKGCPRGGRLVGPRIVAA
jgi:NADH-quinone oxidoreductase subunit F